MLPSGIHGEGGWLVFMSCSMPYRWEWTNPKVWNIGNSQLTSSWCWYKSIPLDDRDATHKCPIISQTHRHHHVTPPVTIILVGFVCCQPIASALQQKYLICITTKQYQYKMNQMNHTFKTNSESYSSSSATLLTTSNPLNMISVILLPNKQILHPTTTAIQNYLTKKKSTDQITSNNSRGYAHLSINSMKTFQVVQVMTCMQTTMLDLLKNKHSLLTNICIIISL